MDEANEGSPDSTPPPGQGAATGLSRLRVRLAKLWVALFGEIYWVGPQWLKRLGHGLRSRPFTAMFLMLLLVGTGLGLERGYRWYRHRPQPSGIALELQAPAVADYNKTPVAIHPLILKFSDPVAPLALVDKAAGAGLELQLHIAG